MIRDYISQSFKEDVYAILLEDIEIYGCRKDDREYILMIEGGGLPAAYLFHLHELTDIIPISSGGENGAKEAAEKMGLELITKIPILDKLKTLSAYACLILLIRERELTRGGEYIELAFLLETGTPPQKIKFIWNQKTPISTMVKELLAKYGFTIHTYKDQKTLQQEIHRIIYYNCIKK